MSPWIPILIMLALGAAFGVGSVFMGRIIGPHKPTAEKLAPYESGMPPVGDARERHPVKFYLVAMIFLVFDVEIVFFYPWATLFPNAAGAVKTLLLVEMTIFIALLLVAYIYAWGKGVFRWD